MALYASLFNNVLTFGWRIFLEDGLQDGNAGRELSRASGHGGRRSQDPLLVQVKSDDADFVKPAAIAGGLGQ